MKRSHTDLSTAPHQQLSASFFPNHLPPAAYHHHDDFNQRQQQQEQNPLQQHSFPFRHEEITSSSPLTADSPPPPAKYAAVTEHHDGASIEQTTRRPRGRPPGSKNKPKPPKNQQQQRQPDPQSQFSPSASSCSITSRIFEVPSGVDIIQALSTFAKNRALCISVLSGAGAVSKFALKQGSSSHTETIQFRGCFDILFLSATLLYRHGGDVSNGGSVSVLNASVSLSGPRGQIVGGILAGPLIASGTVCIVAGSFTSTNHHRLLSAAEAEDENRAAFETEQQHHHHFSRAVFNENENNNISGRGGDDDGYNNSGCGTNNDVIWAPEARQLMPPSSY